VVKTHPENESQSRNAGLSQITSYAPSILIRRLCHEDIPPLHEAVRESLPNLCRWMTWCTGDYAIEDSRSFVLKSARAWDRREEFGFAIIDVQDGSFLGSIGLNQLNPTHQFANVGYWVRVSQAGRGVASAAVLLAARFAFEKLELRRLEFVIPMGNIASQRVAQKAGAKFEGILRSRVALGGHCHDAVMFSLVAADFVSIE
jgi:RimJ/RimL family protein N-acetyltransferase